MDFTYKGDTVLVLEQGSSLVKVAYPHQEEYEAFWIKKDALCEALSDEEITRRFRNGEAVPHETNPTLLSAYSTYDNLVKHSPAARRGQEFDETCHPELTKLLDDLCMDRGLMLIGCNPSYEPEAINFLSAKGVPELQRYLRIGKSAKQLNAGEAHGMWVNIMIPDPQVEDIDIKLGLFFNPHRLMSSKFPGMYQLSKLSYTHRLLGLVTMEERPEDSPDE